MAELPILHLFSFSYMLAAWWNFSSLHHWYGDLCYPKSLMCFQLRLECNLIFWGIPLWGWLTSTKKIKDIQWLHLYNTVLQIKTKCFGKLFSSVQQCNIEHVGNVVSQYVLFFWKNKRTKQKTNKLWRSGMVFLLLSLVTTFTKWVFGSSHMLILSLLLQFGVLWSVLLSTDVVQHTDVGKA